MIDGRGVLIWANGNRFDGQWENGVPKGHGVFTWPDGSCYIGTWGESGINSGRNGDRNEDEFSFERILNGTFYPGNNTGKEERFELSNKLAVKVFDEKSRGSSMERNLPRICIWESEGEAGDITCDIVDNLEASLLYKDATVLDRDGIKHFRRNPCCFSREVKKPGQMISKGHKHYDLMLNLQLGIR